MQPLVTIIVPTYNRAGGLLEATLESILEQDYPNLEVLALDDGSTDQTPEVLARYAERWPERLRWQRHENMGQARTLNLGFELARGEYVGYLSSDDLFLPGAIAKLAAALDDDPEASGAYCSYQVIDEAGEVINRITPIPYTSVDAIRLQDTIVGPGALVRRSALRAAGGWSEEYRWLADFEHWLRIAAQGRLVVIPERLAAWRQHAGAATVSEAGRGMAQERLRLLDAVFADAGPELLAVREEAYRNALVLGAVVIGDESEDSRFHIVDRHARLISERSGHEDAEARFDRVRGILAAQRERIADQQSELNRLNEERATLPFRAAAKLQSLRGRAGAGGREARREGER